MTSPPAALTPTQPDAPTLAAVHRWIAYRLWHTRTPGAQVAIGIRGEPFFSRAYGYADLERQVPMRTDHLFRIASHSKTFTATLVLQLLERGELGLDDPAGRYLPELDEPLADVRIRELLEHTGGVLRDGRDADHWLHRRQFPDREQLLALANEGGLKSVPGARFAYSNIGFSLLGLVIEAVTGEAFADVADAQIVQPLRLTDTTADYAEERAGEYAAAYSGLHASTRRQPFEHVGTYAMAAATGFTSTANDLVTFFGAHAVGDERLLSDRTKRLQQRRVSDADPEHADAGGYGWGMVSETVDDVTYVGHSGGYPGHITKTLLHPESGLVISVMTNAIDGPATPLARGIAQLLAAAQVPAAEQPSNGAIARTGRYVNEWQVTDLAALGGRLLAITPTTWAPLDRVDTLAEDGPSRFIIVSGNGFGSVGEPVTFTGDGEEPGAAVTEMRYGGMSLRPLPDEELTEGQ